MKKLLILYLLLSSFYIHAKPDSTIKTETNVLKDHISQDHSLIEKNLKDMEKKVDKHEEAYNKGVIYGGILIGILGILGVSAVWFYSIIKSKAEKEVVNAIKAESRALSNIFSDIRKEEDIKQKTRIAIFTDDGNEDESLRNILRSNGFGNVDFVKFDKKENAAKYQLIIFTESIDISEINEYIKNSSPYVKYFYFGSKFISDDLAKSFEYRLSSSKFPSQIIGNIMNLLKYN